MTKRAIFLIVIFVAIAAGFGMLLSSLNFRPGVEIIVENETGSTLSSLSVEYTGGPKKLGEIPHGGKKETRIFVNGESSVRLTYLENEVAFTTERFGFLEPHNRGRMIFTVVRNGQCRVKNEITRIL